MATVYSHCTGGYKYPSGTNAAPEDVKCGIILGVNATCGPIPLLFNIFQPYFTLRVAFKFPFDKETTRWYSKFF